MDMASVQAPLAAGADLVQRGKSLGLLSPASCVGGKKFQQPSGNQTCQWKMTQLWVIFLLQPPFMGDVSLPCLITKGFSY